MMMLHDILRRTTLMRLLLLAVIFNLQCSLFNVYAQVTSQITIGGNVYGGGNEGYVGGNTTVTVRAGDLNNVFGGARVASVGGRTFVNIDGQNASDNILAKSVFGGNDISGTIGQSGEATTVPAELENVKTSDADNDLTHNAIDDTWKTFVCTSRSTKTVGGNTVEDKMIVIGNLFGGGNGDYYYEEPSQSGGKIYHYVYNQPYNSGDKPIASKVTTDSDEPGFNIPEIPKTYLEVKGGCIAHVYGGGNNATVTEATVINIDNESTDLQTQAIAYATANSMDPIVILAGLQSKVALTTFQSNLTSYAFTHARVFGGNNKATMNIMPKWNLQKGIIRDLYSGGNEGNMTYKEGLLLDIDPVPANKDLLVINNVYGGCRRADVYPLQPDGTVSSLSQIQLPNTMKDNAGNAYHFPAGLSARTLVRGGKITNVYGGNDISGKVFGGNAVGIYTSILGDVYGGGNGSYAYTDNKELSKLDNYKDFYYDIESVKEKEYRYDDTFDPTQNLSAVQALNLFRPNAEQVSLRLWGEASNPTIIGGSVYVGGNSATLKPKLGLSDDDEPLVELKIGSHVLADKVFLGNNGEDMVKYNAEEIENGIVTKQEGILHIMQRDDFVTGAGKFNTMDLTDSEQFATYMDGCAMTMRPKVVFDLKINETTGDPATYKPYSSYFGSFYCGGNVGSMKYDGSNTINFDNKVIIFDKLVGGSNNADVPEHSGFNAAYSGGLIGNPDNNGNKLVLNLSKLKLQPKRWAVERDSDYMIVLRDPRTNEKVTDPTKGQVTYIPDNTPGVTASRYLEWNVISANTREEIDPVIPDDDAHPDRRLFGANIYGGCCESGHVNGNIVVNIDGTLVDREGEYGVFDSATPTDGDPDILYDHENYTISARRSGVILNEQGMDVLGDALTVFGGGKGAKTEIWGSATVNINKGYCFQVFGGSESGVIGQPTEGGDYEFIGKHYTYNPDYSTYVNLSCERPGASRDDDPSEEMADVEFIYGGGFEGPIVGNTIVKLGNGRLFNLFAGSCNADILGHTETYVGLNGFPYLRDHIYGGNDLGGEIKGSENFSGRVRNYANDKTQIHGYDPLSPSTVPDVLKANAYVEYQQGHMKSIFGGCFGDYDYDEEFKHYNVPNLHNAFVNIRPVDNSKNQIEKVFGAGEGYAGFRGGDKMQDRSYVLIDIDDGMDNFITTEVFGSGSNNGLGMKYPAATTLHVDDNDKPTFNFDDASAIIDLLHGKIRNVFGGSYNEGVTRRTVINVPENSTIWLYSEEPDQDEEADGTKTKHIKDYGNIHGGAYGTLILPPCDVYESNVNYRSDKAIVNGSIFGGNNNERRTLYTNVNIYSPVWSHKDKEVKGYLSTVYGAGKGKDTWSEHTEVNLWDGAQVYEVYGGGMMGHILNAESIQEYMQLYTDGPSDEIVAKNPVWRDSSRWTVDSEGKRTVNSEYADDWADDWADAWTLGDYYKPDVDSNNDGKTDSYDYTTYITNTATNLDQVSDRPELVEVDALTASQFPAKKYNANVIINEGAYVANYAYGGGYGKKKDPLSGDVYGTTYIALLGGRVQKDIYAAGTSGSIYDLFEAKDFTASSNAYIKGGTCRNVYGGGWEGNVGAHTGDISASPTNDIPGETHVVIGCPEEKIYSDSIANSVTKHGFYYGRPAIQRNAYGGGEGGAVYGTAHLNLNNGYIGYQYDASNSDNLETAGIDEHYVEKIEDDTYRDNNNVFIPNERLRKSGCLFGGGYVDNSSVDKTEVYIYGGHVRNSAFGGGEIAAVGRGTIAKTTSGGKTTYTLSGIHRPGKTVIEMYGGHVHHNVYGGGRGYDNLNKHGSLNSDGYVFGQTEVHVHGGEIGTKAELSDSVGNVFGGGDVGFVYSAYENVDGTFGRGVKPAGSERYNDENPGYYYKHKWYGDTTTGSDIDEEGFYTSYVTVNGVTKKERFFTEDCKVLVEPFCKVTSGSGVTINNIFYPKNATVSHLDLKYLQAKGENVSQFCSVGSGESLSDYLDADGNVTADDGFTITSRTYSAGEYVPTYSLNTLGKKSGDNRWNSLDPTGIIIHNAVFAGGNTSITSTSGAGGINTPSVFGNATASIHDVYHRDLITLGTRHTGGLYGDGNLTLVDGYRELNVTNYGTDYYSIAKEITNSEYHALPDREAAYYELTYTCQKDCKDKDDTSYKKATTDANGFVSKASTITADELQNLFLILNEETGEYSSVMDGSTAIMIWNETNSEWVPNESYWLESGVLPVYAGRLMNSIQRADFCGVYGSRMVMQGARDRVPKEPDFTDYTINRVREVSLNKKESVIATDNEKYTAADEAADPSHKEGNYKTPEAQKHGNYFGIYNIVNYLGALTSDVDFGGNTGGDVRTTDNTDSKYNPDFDGQTFYDWKKNHNTERIRNNGNSHNKVALASGVYLELTTEESTGTGLFEKVWGPITGVIELDLINVSTGIGGGFVYAKNVHGERTKTNRKNTTLTSLNSGAVTKWDYEYTSVDANKEEWETSGNFVHSTQTIIDDCYNVSNRYKGAETPDGSGAMPAHYWYIKGSVYVYPQLISAHTGLPNAYSEVVEIPLTISAASHGTIKLLNVQPNLYAFYSSPGVELGTGKKVVINDKEYYKNDPISYWDWYLLSKSEKALFVEETYVNCVACTIDGTPYEAGEYVMTQNQYNTFAGQTHTYKDDEGNDVLDGERNVATTDYIFRLSNNLSHDTGYILTYEVNNPEIWNTWYTPKQGSYTGKINTKEYGENTTQQQDYNFGPTYRLKATTGGEVLGQQKYKVGDVISQTVQDAYSTIPNTVTLTNQATFESAYIVTKAQTVQETNGEVTVNRHLNPGVVVSETVKGQLEANTWEKAYVCTSTVKLSDTEFIFRDTKMTESEYNAYCDRFSGTTDAEKKIKAEILSKVVSAYYCTEAGSYGGRYYQSNYNYLGLEAWSSMSETDREKFNFNYDALDLLIDPNYSNLEGKKYQYDGSGFTEETDVRTQDEDGNWVYGNKAGYSVVQSVDYTASYTGSEALSVGKDITVQRYNETSGKNEPTTTSSVLTGDELSREDFEALPNEKRHYSPIVVESAGNYYVVNTAFQIGSTPYAVGNTISSTTYQGLPDSEKNNITIIAFGEDDENKKFYYCREAYKIETNGHPVISTEGAKFEKGATVNLGTLIREFNTTVNEKEYIGYSNLTNDQKDFTIHGISPTETSTLFVSRESDIHNLSQDKIITVIYQYDYEESDASGNITPVSERHVLNIRIQFKSGVPIVEDIDAPDIILPGDYIAPVEPNVIFDANALLEPGWELYETERDAQSHVNGVKFDYGRGFNPTEDPLYWFQDGWYLSYYISTMESGRSYSNYVPVRVANYHDLKEVMTAKDHHYYIDEKGVKRAPKVYIRDYSKDETGSKNGLDLFKDLFDLSLVSSSSSSSTDGYTVKDGKVTAAAEGANSNIVDHSLLKNQVRAGRNLEFFLRTDIDYSAPSGSPARTWTPIGYDGVSDDPSTPNVDEGAAGKCFDGVLHGDGHTISGLDHSLFGYLCGEVYNLGVRGSFTGAGVAETGDGYVESCWIKTSATSVSPAGTKAVFGNPSASGEQSVNCYYPESNNGYTAGKAIMKPDRAFYTGEVAYDLNNFYLYKRYNDNANPGGTTSYKYWKAGEATPLTGTYAQNADLCSSGYNSLKYVEDRFDDGDFIYDGGDIGGILPDSQNERYFLETITNSETGVTSTKVHHYPIWPDDYLFFGQKLTYGHTEEAHQNVPSAIVKSDKRLSLNADANRVYRAPAYFRSGKMNVAHFNPDAVFAQTKKGDAATLAYKDMTAIDFTGSNGDVAHDYEKGYNTSAPYANIAGGAFYPPLLDDDGLTGFLNVDLTKNLLVYTAATGANTTAAEKTATVVRDYLTEPAYTESTDGYRTVAEQPTADIHGHWVENSIATLDHLLVDRQDFNAPISYTFDTGKRMWHQRVPTNYVDRTKGWEAISLPFSAELVTTHQKGEITHFYDGSETSKNGTATKIGHEYWLRKLENESTMEQAKDKDNIAIANTLVATFNYPSTTDGSVLFNKTGDNGVTNTFLWDYYYKGITGGHDQKDKNKDTYQEYYSELRQYANYPLLTNGTPYILGLPGTTYYEFDLSGEWEALTTKNTKPGKLEKQFITFASVPGTTIQVSDSEMDGSTATYNSKPYTFKPNYLNSPALKTDMHAFLLNAEGSSYEESSAATANVDAFRPYFIAEAGSSSREVTRSILFSNGNGERIGNHDDDETDLPGVLDARAGRHKIIITSTMKIEADVRIINAAGQTIASFTIEPGETIETHIVNAGVYLVQSVVGEYTRKFAVK